MADMIDDIEEPTTKRRMRYNDFDLDKPEWLTMLRHYRTLRIRIPGYPPGADQPLKARSEGLFYGCDREETRRIIETYWCELSWYTYLGSK